MSDNEDVKCGWKTRADELSASLVQVAQERAAAKADAARLREALEEIARPKRGGIEANDSDEEWFEYLRNALERERAIARSALSATDSAEWLEKHDAAVTADMERAIEAQAESVRMYAAKVEALEAQLAAATNDAARAELRARDLGDALQSIAKVWRDGALSESQVARALGASLIVTRRAIDAIDAPDSDARLREVMAAAVNKAVGIPNDVRWKETEAIVDEVLGAKP